MSLLISAKVGRSGKSFCLGVTTDTPGITGYPPLALLGAVAGSGLVVYDNGTPVTLSASAWDDGTNGLAFTGAILGFYITSGPIAPGHTVTFDVPAAFLTADSLSSPAVTGGHVTNFSGLAHGTPEGAWGHFPPLPTTDLIPVGWNVGQFPLSAQWNSFMGKDKMLTCSGWGVYSGSGTISGYDLNGYPVSWSSPAGTVLYNSLFSPDGTNGLADDKGYGNAIGVYTIYYIDTAYGTSDQKTVVLLNDPIASYVAIGSPTVTIIDTDIVCVKMLIAYNTATPAGWGLKLHLMVSAPSNSGGTSDWTIQHPCHPGVPGNPMVVLPKAADGTAAATPDFTKPYAIDDNVLASWITPNGVGPCLLRAMESFGGASLCNHIYACDLIDVGECSWQFFGTDSATAGYVRRFSTDGTLAWQTTKIYGPQAMFVTPDATTYTLGVTFTAGSYYATLTSGTPQLCGSSVTACTGTGSIPVGTLLGHFDMTRWNTSGSTLVFDAKATASGSATLTLQHPNYIPLPIGDNGSALNGSYGLSTAPVQMRFATPHPFTTGQQVAITANGNGISYTNGLGYVDWSGGGALNARIWVHDAYTISFVWDPGDPAGGSTAFTEVNATTEYDFTGASGGGWACAMQVSNYPVGVSDEFMAGACASIGADYWMNLESFGTDRLWAERARRVVAAGGSSLKVRLEYQNEVWNGGNPYSVSYQSHHVLAYLGGYLPTNTIWMHYYTAVFGDLLPFFGDFATGPSVLCAAYSQYVFTNAWTSAGASGTRITRLQGTGFSQQNATVETAGMLQLLGAPCDYIVLAPYYSMLGYASIGVAAYAAQGNWPVDAYLDFIATEFTFNYYVQNTFAQHSASLGAGWGQPTISLPVNAGGSGSSLPGGGYSTAYTYVDGSGGETMPGQSKSPGLGISSGQNLTTTMPGLPPNVASINIYLGGSANPPSTFLLYGNYPRSTGTGTTITLTHLGTGGNPPTTNGAPGLCGDPPGLGTYEGIPATIAPVGLPGWGGMEHDCRAHPSFRDLMYAYCASLQIGEQSTGGGPAWVNLFQYYDVPGWNGPAAGYDEFAVSFAQSQLPGPGTSNTYATAQGWAGTSTPGVTPDGADHNGGAPAVSSTFGDVQVINDSPGAQGILDWMAASSPTPTPTATPARRALPGLRAIM